MNILFLSTRSPYPLISGHSLRTYHILKGAAGRHNVTLVTYVQLKDELKPENLSHLSSFCKAVYPFQIPSDESRARLFAELTRNLISPRPFVAQKYGAWEVRSTIRNLLKREKFDLVHVDLLPLTTYENEFTSYPKILVNHNVESLRLYRWFQAEPNPAKKAYLGLQWVKLRAYEKSAMQKYDCCVVVSEIDKKILRKMGVQGKIFVVPNGTDTEFFKPLGKKRKKDSVLWIGHMDVHTNKDAVLFFWRDIYPILKRKYPDVHLTFVGTAPPKEIAEAAKNQENVRVTGFVDDIRPYLDEVEVMIVPIRIGSGTRLKILDSMAMGKAIVSTSVGCEGLNVTDGKDILIADAPEEFADKIILLLRDADRRADMEKNALTLARTYDWGHITKKQEAVYQEALRARD